MIKADADYLFEASWEVCNHVGGIYTVVKSKAALMNEFYRNYFLIGPYFLKHAQQDMQAATPPKEIKEAFEELEHEGIICYYGKWMIKGEPRVILVDSRGYALMKNQIKKEMWEGYKVDTIASQWDYDEPMIWSWAVGRLLHKIADKLPGQRIVTHFHEWLAGISILYLKRNRVPVSTVFTTHATMLGRSIAGGGQPLYQMIEQLNPTEEAYRHNVQDKHLTEKAAANAADVFTTVSEITSYEAEKLLGRKADVLVLNGLDIDRFPTFEETSIKHKQGRTSIRDFLSYYFFPYYYFDLEQTLTFFISGRYEFKNKGIDIFIAALKGLNERLKAESSDKTVVVFFWIPANVHGIRTELMESKDFFRNIQRYVDDQAPVITSRIVTSLVAQTDLTCDALFDQEFMHETRKQVVNFARQGLPPLCTHNLLNEGDDPIMRTLREQGLINRPEDRVKVIFYPVYLTGTDGLIDLGLYDVMMGCHLGVFPSYYEPWGYTPLESAALGVPSVTTDLGGFGRFIRKKTRQDGGIFVLNRMKASDDETVSQFTEILHMYTILHRKERVEQKIIAKELSELADWKILLIHYIEAHNLALERMGAGPGAADAPGGAEEER